MSPLRIAVLWGPVVAFMAAVWGLAGETDVRGSVPLWDKALHAGAWFVFGLCCLRATHGGLGMLRARPTCWAVALAVGYGMLDEWHQRSIPGREASWLDVGADTAGVGLAVACMGLLGSRLSVDARRGSARPR